MMYRYSVNNVQGGPKKLDCFNRE